MATNVYLRTLETPLTTNVRLEDPTALSSGGATANGATLTATASLIAGAATGDANASGATVTATASVVSGAATGGAAASGATLTVTASVVSGAATGGAAASGATLTVTASVVSGAATGGASASGSTVSVVASLIVGAATGESGEVAPEVIYLDTHDGSAADKRQRANEKREDEWRDDLRRIVENAFAVAFDEQREIAAEVSIPQERKREIAREFAPIVSMSGIHASIETVARLIETYEQQIKDEQDEDDVSVLLLAA